MVFLWAIGFIRIEHIRRGGCPKKEKMWTMGNAKGPTGPWVWHAWVKGSKKPVRVVAFDLDHIKCQLEGKTVIKAVKATGGEG